MELLTKLYEAVTQYIQAELLILIPVLFGIGVILKRSKHIADNNIPLLLMILGILLSIIWLTTKTQIETAMDSWEIVFNGICQGVLTASGAVFANQMIKQYKKSKTE